MLFERFTKLHTQFPLNLLNNTVCYQIAYFSDILGFSHF